MTRELGLETLAAPVSDHSHEAEAHPIRLLLDALGEGLSPDARDALAEGNPVAARAVSVWIPTARRLRLGPSSVTVGSLIVLAELDGHWREFLLGDERMTAAPRRSAILSAATQVSSADDAAEGLAQLEHRGIVRLLKGYGGPWLAGELELHSDLRHRLLSGSPRVAAAVPPRTALVRARVERVRARVQGRLDRVLVVLRGARGSGRDAVADHLLSEMAVPSIVRSPAPLPEAILGLEPELSGAVAIWDARGADPTGADYRNAAAWLDRSCGLAIAIVDGHQDPPEVGSRTLVSIDADPDDHAERQGVWRDALTSVGIPVGTADAAGSELARRSRAGAGLAVRCAMMAELDPTMAASEVVDNAYRAVGELARPSSSRGITVETPTRSMDDLVLADETRGGLEELLVLGSTQDAADSDRRGAKALFCGPTGTGKTLAARVVACALGRPLYRVDLASVVSKWVGETEKNLMAAMSSAQNAGAVLLFDEGEALMSRRGSVDRGSDRYANLEVSFLLQAFEAHDGVVIVTTNLRHQIDVAFTRRFDVLIDFRPPTLDERAVLWRYELGDAGQALDDTFFRRTLASAELSGGNIAAAARLARAFALSRGDDEVTERDVCRAVRGELVKIGATAQAGQWAQRHGVAAGRPEGGGRKRAD